ncbi:TPA: hypothetical protein RRX44_005250, partial [Klebsiella pneumoniae]|nr:hypothetical protein [Klebsiella pneumoniae]
AAFNTAGFESISPEVLTLPQQLLLWNLSSKVACINGTLPLNFLFGSNSLNLIVLNKTNLVHRNLDDVLEIKKHKTVVFIDAFEPCFRWASKNIGDGPFVLKVTPSLQKYLGIKNTHQYGVRFYIKASLFVFSFKLKYFSVRIIKKIAKKTLNIIALFNIKTNNH